MVTHLQSHNAVLLGEHFLITWITNILDLQILGSVSQVNKNKNRKGHFIFGVRNVGTDKSESAQNK